MSLRVLVREAHVLIVMTRKQQCLRSKGISCIDKSPITMCYWKITNLHVRITSSILKVAWSVECTRFSRMTAYRLIARNTFSPPPPPGWIVETMFFWSPMSDEYFGRLIATGEWGVCLLSSCKVRYPHNEIHFFKSSKVKVLSLDIKYIMFFGVTVQKID